MSGFHEVFAIITKSIDEILKQYIILTYGF